MYRDISYNDMEVMMFSLKANKENIINFIDMGLGKDGEFKFSNLIKEPFKFIEEDGIEKCVICLDELDDVQKEDFERIKDFLTDKEDFLSNSDFDEIDWVKWRIVNWGSPLDVPKSRRKPISNKLRKTKKDIMNSKLKNNTPVFIDIPVDSYFPSSCISIIEELRKEIPIGYKLDIDGMTIDESNAQDTRDMFSSLLCCIVACSWIVLTTYKDYNDFKQDEEYSKIMNSQSAYQFNVDEVKYVLTTFNSGVIAMIDKDKWRLIH